MIRSNRSPLVTRFISSIMLLAVMLFLITPWFVFQLNNKVENKISPLIKIILFGFLLIGTTGMLIICLFELTYQHIRVKATIKWILWYMIALLLAFIPVSGAEWNGISKIFSLDFTIDKLHTFQKIWWLLIIFFYYVSYLANNSSSWGNIFVWNFFSLLIIFAFKGYYCFLLDDKLWPCIFSVCLFAYFFDSNSYLIGRKIGKNKLAPIISPKKTWEGTIGGISSVILLGSALFCLNLDTKYLLPQYFKNLFANNFLSYLLYLFFLCISFQFGDLLFSFWKRLFNFKDFGTWIPGHGGLLDRFDSMILFFAIIFIFQFFASLGP